MQYLSTGDYVVIVLYFVIPLAPAERRKMEQEHRRDIAAVPVVMLWQVTMYLAPMQALIRLWEAFGITLALHIGAFVATYFTWYRHLPGAGEAERA